MSREAPTENNVAHAGEEKKKKKKKGKKKRREEPWLFKESRVFHVLTRDQSPCHETFLNYRRCPSPLWARGGRERGGVDGGRWGGRGRYTSVLSGQSALLSGYLHSCMIGVK